MRERFASWRDTDDDGFELFLGVHVWALRSCAVGLAVGCGLALLARL
jgi:hypothetical protein